MYARTKAIAEDSIGDSDDILAAPISTCSTAALSPTFDLIFAIHVEHEDGRPPNVGLSNDHRSPPLEVINPILCARIEELHRMVHIAGVWINSRQIARLG